MKMALQIGGTTVVDNSRNIVNVGTGGITFSDGTIQTSSSVVETVFGGNSITPNTGVTATFPSVWKRIELYTYGPDSGGQFVNVSEMKFFDANGVAGGGYIRVASGQNGTNVVSYTPNYRTYSGSLGTLAAPIFGTTNGWPTSNWILQKIPDTFSIDISGSATGTSIGGYWSGNHAGQGPLTSATYTFTSSTTSHMRILMRVFN
jgi:hypothetical protein